MTVLRSANHRVRHIRLAARQPKLFEKRPADESWQSTQTKQRAWGGGPFRCWIRLLCVQSLRSLPVLHVVWREREVVGCVIGDLLFLLTHWFVKSQDHTDWRSSWRLVGWVAVFLLLPSETSRCLSVWETRQLKSSCRREEIKRTQAHAYLEIHETETAIYLHQAQNSFYELCVWNDQLFLTTRQQRERGA